MNPAQLYESELNFIASEIRKKAKTFKKFKTDILKFYSKVSPEYYTFITELEELDDILKEAYSTGVIQIHQPPFFENIAFEVMIELYNDFNISKLKFKGIQTPLIMGKLYFLKLQHEALAKFSARSANSTNLLDVPYKTNERQKKGNALYNTNPVRMGEQENLNMLLLKQPELQNKFISTYASSNKARNNMLTQLLTTELSDITEIELEGDTIPNSTQTTRAIFASIGVDIHNESDE